MPPTAFIIPSFLYGFVIFLLYGLFSDMWKYISPHSWQFPEYVIIPKTDSESEIEISTSALSIAILIGFVLSFVVSFLMNHKILHRLARSINVTQKFGDRDVWSYIINSDGVQWIIVRDVKIGIYYVGELHAFSDEEEQRELVLKNVVAYDNEKDGKELYEAGTMYFSFPKEGLRLEIIYSEE